jgi:hypothetical protein
MTQFTKTMCDFLWGQGGSVGGSTQDLVLTKQVFYHFSHTLTFFALVTIIIIIIIIICSTGV